MTKLTPLTPRDRSRPDTLPRANRLILSMFFGVFACVGLASLWALWNNPCSWIGINWRETGCEVRHSDSYGGQATFLGEDQWLFSIEQVAIIETVGGDNQQRIPFIHEGRVEALLVSHDQSKLATLTRMEGVCPCLLVVWDIATQTRLFEQELSADSRLAAFAADGSQVVVAGRELDYTVWEVATGDVLAEWTNTWGVAYSPDGATVTVVSAENVTLYTMTFDPIKQFSIADPAQIACPVYAPNGEWITLNDTKTLRVVSIETEELIFEWPETDRYHRCAFSFSADSSTLIISAFSPQKMEATIEIWDIPTNQQIRTFDTPYAIALSVALSPDQTYIAIASAGTTFLIK